MILSKEEIKKAKGWLSALDVKSEYEASSKEIILSYIEELEEKTNPSTIEYTGGNFENDIERYIKRRKKERINNMEYKVEISEESAEKLHKLFDSKFEELKEAHNRFKRGTETTEDLLEHYKHYRMDVETKKVQQNLDLIELKYYEKLVNIVKKQDKVINKMVETLVGLTVWDNEKDEPFILGDKEEVKEYFEKKVEEQ